MTINPKSLKAGNKVDYWVLVEDFMVDLQLLKSGYASFSEDDQQFFERGFHRLWVGSIFRREASVRFFEGLLGEPVEAERQECRRLAVLQVHEGLGS